MIVKEHHDEFESYLKDASNIAGGQADTLFLPDTADDIALVLRNCNEQHTPVTVSGARTGLAGGSVPHGGVILSMERMNGILSIDTDTMRACVEPGVLLGEFQKAVEELGAFYPPDPTERTCQIGGSIATNASGARTFKYGPTRNYVVGLEVICATGETISLQRGEVSADDRIINVKTKEGREIRFELPPYSMPTTSKHAAGYYIHPGMDAIDLFIGSEGTLGVISSIEVRLVPKPEQLVSGIVFFPDEEATISFVKEIRERSLATRKRSQTTAAPDIDSRAIEFIDYNALEFIRDHYPEIPHDAFGGAIWFEQETTAETEEKLLEFWYEALGRHSAMLDDSWFAISEHDQQKMREFRHTVPSTVLEYITRHSSTKLGTDMAVPDDVFPELLAFYRQQFAESGLTNVTWGHIGNSHLHANILLERDDQMPLATGVYDSFVRKALELHGTVSAEHGVGKMKREYLQMMYGPEAIDAMRRLKQAFDPNHILGRGTMFEYLV